MTSLQTLVCQMLQHAARLALDAQRALYLGCIRHGLVCGLSPDELAAAVCVMAIEAGRLLAVPS